MRSGSGGDEVLHSHDTVSSRGRPRAQTLRHKESCAPSVPRRRAHVRPRKFRFLDAFGGVGGVTAECAKLGVTGTVYDIAVNPECDFRRRPFARSTWRLASRRSFVLEMFHTHHEPPFVSQAIAIHKFARDTSL